MDDFQRHFAMKEADRRRALRRRPDERLNRLLAEAQEAEMRVGADETAGEQEWTPRTEQRDPAVWQNALFDPDESSQSSFTLLGGRGRKDEAKYKGKTREHHEAELKAAEESGHKQKRPSTREKHQNADATRRRDKGGEKGDKRRHWSFPTPTGAAWGLYKEWRQQQITADWFKPRPGETKEHYEARTRYI